MVCENADELRMAVKEIICDNGREREKYEEALVAITVEESLKRYISNPLIFFFLEFVSSWFLIFLFDIFASISPVIANVWEDLIFGEESQSYWLVFTNVDLLKQVPFSYLFCFC